MSTEEKYTIKEIRKCIDGWMDEASCDELITMLQRKEPEFVEGQIIVSRGDKSLIIRSSLPMDFSLWRHQNPTEVGPKYMPVEEVQKFVRKIERWHPAIPSGHASNAIRDAFIALPANLRGGSDD